MLSDDRTTFCHYFCIPTFLNNMQGPAIYLQQLNLFCISENLHWSINADHSEDKRVSSAKYNILLFLMYDAYYPLKGGYVFASVRSLFVCLSVCLSVSRIMQKVSSDFLEAL